MKRMSISQMPWCCGAYEAGSFCNAPKSLGAHHPKSFYEQDSWEEILPMLFEDVCGQPVHFNFFRESRYDRDDEMTWDPIYDCAELRELVMKHPNAKHIGCFINSNSDNIVDSWVIFTGEDASDN